MKADRKEDLMRPKYKATESEGYTMLVVLKDTGTNPECWAQFRNLGGVDLSCDQIQVKITEKGEPIVWDNPHSSHPNSHDLRSLYLAAACDGVVRRRGTEKEVAPRCRAAHKPSLTIDPAFAAIGPVRGGGSRKG